MSRSGCLPNECLFFLFQSFFFFVPALQISLVLPWASPAAACVAAGEARSRASEGEASQRLRATPLVSAVCSRVCVTPPLLPAWKPPSSRLSMSSLAITPPRSDTGSSSVPSWTLSEAAARCRSAKCLFYAGRVKYWRLKTIYVPCAPRMSAGEGEGLRYCAAARYTHLQRQAATFKLDGNLC
ncbi:hypothetical protein HPB48_018913 [Haemaphysalis longicornis]|uniref:Uncharacterized protein n=1 Tax=Haemaphysalis longicornis TaxID=44386 RepID=A0A9J6G455_HAELO|nr:hypothetical protein HPB48_018913 [Haemaphysalis longicornis]